MTDPLPDSYVRNCYVQPREGDSLFQASTDADGKTVWRAMLDGYAIIPMERYQELLPKSGPTDPPLSSAST